MKERTYSLPIGEMYLVLPNGAAAQLTSTDVNVLQVAMDHFIEHIEDVNEYKFGRWPGGGVAICSNLESAHFLRDLLR